MKRGKSKCQRCEDRPASPGERLCDRCRGVDNRVQNGARGLALQSDALKERLEKAAVARGMTSSALLIEILEVWLLEHENIFPLAVGKYD